jgi:3-oxoacyl-[acyl-carrier protein] reductase
VELSFKDKVVLITGGTRGIGRTIAENFARRGATTLITYASSQSQADELVNSLRKEGGNVHAYKVDIKDTEAMDTMIDGIAKEFGQIDVLVNNAGIVRDTLILTMDKAAWTDVITTNLTGAYNTIRPISRLMLRKRSGAIINMSSIAASKPGRGHSNYAASKGGIEAMTRALAAELGGKGVRVNCVAPGMIETEMSQAVRDHAGDQILDSIVLKRYGKTQDIANAVMFLASDLSSYITGEVLHVDGGIRG